MHTDLLIFLRALKPTLFLFEKVLFKLILEKEKTLLPKLLWLVRKENDRKWVGLARKEKAIELVILKPKRLVPWMWDTNKEKKKKKSFPTSSAHQF